jgi:hypothetical protein
MARKRGKKALYEVMNESRLKSSAGSQLEPLRQEKAKKETPATLTEDTAVRQEPVMWWKKPKLIQFNKGRIEISLPYQIAVVVVLFLILLVLAAFRLGQLEQKIGGSASQVQPGEETNLARLPTRDAGLNPALREMIPPAPKEAESAEPAGNNRIVIQTHQVITQLMPVKEYFGKHGIETEIRQVGGRYCLITKAKYQNTEIEGSDGYLAKQRIIELGADYEAPPGYEPFGARSFASAYGMKFDD